MNESDFFDVISEAKLPPRSPKVGMRVAFFSSMESFLTYTNPPAKGSCGTVVQVKCASGNTTSDGDYVFVKWDGGGFLPVLRRHLRVTSTNTRRANDITFQTQNLAVVFASYSLVGKDELVHKATRDLWSFRKDADEYVIERLFDNNGNPLKV